MADPIELSRYFTPEDLRRGAGWLRTSNVVGVTDLAVDALLLMAFSIGPPGRWLWSRLAARLTRAPNGPIDRLLGAEWRTGAAFLGLLVIVRHVAAFPLDCYLHYFQAHRFGLSHESLASFTRRAVIGVLLTAPSAAILGGVIGAVRSRWPNRWWLVTGLASAILLFADAAAEPMLLRVNYRVEPLAAGPLRTRIEKELSDHDADVGAILTMDASRYGTEVNAFVSGFGPTRQLILTDTLLRFGDEAVVGAVGHELGHRRDQRLPGRLALAGLGMIAFLWLTERTLRWGHARGAAHPAQALPLVKVLLTSVMVVLLPARMAFSRAEENEADGVELSIRRDYDAYVDEQVRLVRSNALDPDPPAFVRALMSHPSPAERISRALWYKQRLSQAP